MKRRQPKSAKDLERRVAFRVNPPGQKGRPRQHYPPSLDGRTYEATLVKTIYAVTHFAKEEGGFAVVRQSDGRFVVWSQDTRYGVGFNTRSEAINKAKSEARRRDYSNFWWVRIDFSDYVDPLLSLSSDDKRRLGRMMRNAYGEIWRRLGPTLCFDIDCGICSDRLADHLRCDIAEWCDEQEMRVVVHDMLPFTILEKHSVYPIYTWVLEFETEDHAFWFLMRWGGDDVRR